MKVLDNGYSILDGCEWFPPKDGGSATLVNLDNIDKLLIGSWLIGFPLLALRVKRGDLRCAARRFMLAR